MEIIPQRSGCKSGSNGLDQCSEKGPRCYAIQWKMYASTVFFHVPVTVWRSKISGHVPHISITTMVLNHFAKLYADPHCSTCKPKSCFKSSNRLRSSKTSQNPFKVFQSHLKFNLKSILQNHHPPFFQPTQAPKKLHRFKPSCQFRHRLLGGVDDQHRGSRGGHREDGANSAQHPVAPLEAWRQATKPIGNDAGFGNGTLW